MAVRLVGALLARNEAAPDRYLRKVLDNLLHYCDTVVVVDDGSTDDTAAVCAADRCRVISRQSDGFWGADEITPRRALWEAAVAEVGVGGWIYVADADHELVGIGHDALRRCLRSTAVTAWSLPLWDCWTENGTMLRSDSFWQAHLHPRPWFFRVLPDFQANWSAIDRKGVHTGHCPPNFPLVCGILQGAAIRHWGYAKASHREAKHRHYMALA